MTAFDTPAVQRVVCAYDGTVNGHWVARYAIRLATNSATPALRLVHVHDGHISKELLERKLEHVLTEATRAGVASTVHDLRGNADVAAALVDALPAGPDTLLVCGARARSRRGRFLSGTVAEALLRGAGCHVLALRVMMPGLLGTPRRLLLPVAGNPGEARAVAPIVSLLAPALQQIHLLRVMLERNQAARLSTAEVTERVRAHGLAAVTRFEAELRAAAAIDGIHLDAYVRVAHDWARATSVIAGQHRCELVLAGASDRALAGSFLRRGPLETLLADAPCDIGIYRGAR